MGRIGDLVMQSYFAVKIQRNGFELDIIVRRKDGETLSDMQARGERTARIVIDRIKDLKEGYL